MSKEFCPSYCGNIDKPIKSCSDPTPLSDGNRSKDGCYHLDDEVLDKPWNVELVWTRDQTREEQIVGQNGDSWILSDTSTVQKGSPLIKRRWR